MRAFGWACRLYPRKFRRLFANDMIDTFAGDLGERTDPVRFTVATIAHVAGEALRQRLLSLLPVSEAPQARNEMSNFLADIRYAARSLRRQPSFAAAAILTLAVAIGAGTAVYSVVDSVLLQPLPYTEPDELVVLWEHNLPRERLENVVHPRNYEAWVEASDLLADSAVLMPASSTIERDGERFRVPAVRVSPAYFRMLGVEPALGRWLLPEEADSGGADVVVLSHAVWSESFGGDPGIVDKTVTLQGTPHRVVGVMPADFRPPKIGWVQQQVMWLPFGITEEVRGYGRSLVVLARLRQGVGLDAARAEFDAIGASLAAEYPRNQNWSIRVVRLHRQMVGSVETAMWTVLAGVGLLLLIACANVGSLMLTRTDQRGAEFALRTALGAGSGRIVRQLLTEGLVLAAAGGLLGAVLGIWLLDLVQPVLPDSLPRLPELRLNPAVFVIVALISAFAVIATGLFPGIRARGLDLRAGIGAQTTRRESPGRRALVVAEISLAVILTVAAGLLVRSYGNLSATELGIQTRDVLALRVSLSERFSDNGQRSNAFERIVSDVARQPGVASAATMSVRPFGGATVATSVQATAAPIPEGEEKPSAGIRQVSDELVATLGMRMISGRTFDGGDLPGMPARVLVNENLARRLWPGEDAIGRSLSISLGDGIDAEVIGVFADVRFGGPEVDPRPDVLRATTQFPSRTMDLIVRGDGALPDLAATRRTVLDVDPAATIYDVAPLDGLLSDASAERRFTTGLLSSFAVIATLLAGIGVYGVLASDVAARRRELAVRVALGAASADVVRFIVRGGMGRALVGVAAGIVASIGLTRFMSGLLFGVSPTDTATLVTVGGILLLVALATNVIPALRALRVDPVTAMRNE